MTDQQMADGVRVFVMPGGDHVLVQTGGDVFNIDLAIQHIKTVALEDPTPHGDIVRTASTLYAKYAELSLAGNGIDLTLAAKALVVGSSQLGSFALMLNTGDPELAALVNAQATAAVMLLDPEFRAQVQAAVQAAAEALDAGKEGA
jgi:hypothetical protein